MKLLKIFIFIIFILYFEFIFASSEISLITNKDKIDISETLDLEVSIKYDWEIKESQNYAISWFENFDILWKTSYMNKMIKSWKETQSLTYKFKLQAKKAGVFSIEILDKKKIIEVVWEKLTVWVNDSLMNFSKEDYEKDKLLYKKTSSLSSNSWTVFTWNIDQNNNWTDIKNMKDIYDIKSQAFIWPFSFISILLFIIIIFIIFLLYYTYTRFIKNKKNFLEIKEIKQVDYKKILDFVELEYINSQKDVFYWKLWEFIRQYLDDKVEAWLSFKTLYEIKSYLKYDLYNLVEIIYFPEYNNKEDTREQRLEILALIRDKLWI